MHSSHLNNSLQQTDPQIHQLIQAEEQRQKETLRMIPSENYASKAVMEATGSVLTNKYSEGYPGKRYYEGQEIVDQVENLAIQRAKKLFNAEHANVQPYSGSPANQAAYYALLEPGAKIMGLNLLEGGHLTHGWKANFSARFYESASYGVDKDTEMINYDRLEAQVALEKPDLIIAGATAYPREVDFERFHKIAKSHNALLLADISHINGLIVAGEHPDPVPYADVVTSTSHKAIRGPRGGFILSKKKYAKAIDKAIMPGNQGGPHNHTTAAMAVAFHEASQPEFKTYAKAIKANASALASELKKLGFSLVTDGTDNHLILLNTIRSHDIPGKTFSQALYKAGIETNYNMVPFDTRSPMDPSGVRIGTPALTSRGMTESDMTQVAKFFQQVAENIQDETKLSAIHQEVLSFVNQFPIY
jgi:glycine hydroxymethyltransferase